MPTPMFTKTPSSAIVTPPCLPKPKLIDPEASDGSLSERQLQTLVSTLAPIEFVNDTDVPSLDWLTPITPLLALVPTRSDTRSVTLRTASLNRSPARKTARSAQAGHGMQSPKGSEKLIGSPPA